ncbi:MAG: hypothetical protein WC120_05385 [Parcubacteria group bacterium]|jgi:hypothetical protein
MTFMDLSNAFKQITGDTNEVFWTAAMKLAWANEAIGAAARLTEAIEKRATIISVADQGEYTLPSDVQFVQRVAFDGEALEFTNKSNLSRSDRNWTDDPGTPFQFYLDMMNGKVGLYYVPQVATTLSTFIGEYGVLLEPETGSALGEYGSIVDPLDATDFYSSEYGDVASGVSGNDIEVFYVSSATAIAAAETPDLPPWSHGLILFWMLARAYEAETQLQNVGASQLFMHLAEKIIGRLAVRSKGKLPKVWQMQAGYSRRDDDPDVDDRFQYASET